MTVSAFTIDVECGINLALRDFCNIQIPPTERVVSLTMRIVDLLEKHQTQATFFVLGDVAAHYPQLVRDIDARGHEVGVHSHAHFQLFKHTPESAREDTYRAKSTIEELIGKPVYGYRAPAFSLTPKTSWALEMLAELGFEYDSSIMPAKTRRYGWPNFPEDIVEVDLPNQRKIIEFPLSVTKVLAKKIPCCGGGYLRLFPFSFTKRAFQNVQAKRAVNVYIHPYEIDTEPYPEMYHAAVRKLPIKRRLALETFRVNKDRLFKRLALLLEKHRFSTCREIISAAVDTKRVGQISYQQALALAASGS